MKKLLFSVRVRLCKYYINRLDDCESIINKLRNAQKSGIYMSDFVWMLLYWRYSYLNRKIEKLLQKLER